MKIRGNKDGAETSFLTSYFLPNKLIAQVIALNLNKISKIPINFLTFTSSYIVVIHFTTNT